MHIEICKKFISTGHLEPNMYACKLSTLCQIILF